MEHASSQAKMTERRGGGRHLPVANCHDGHALAVRHSLSSLSRSARTIGRFHPGRREDGHVRAPARGAWAATPVNMGTCIAMHRNGIT
jgi:hypothetical protein